MLPSLLVLATLVPSQSVFADGRDDRTLLVQKLINRNLGGQLGEHRLGKDLGPFLVAGDLLINGQLPVGEGIPAPFHGFFFLDTYLSVRVFDTVDVNLNVFVLNRTASGGFRVQSSVLPGLAAHWHPTLGVFEGHPVTMDLLAVDLDVVTLGAGLLLETTPLEGFLVGFDWNGFGLRSLFGGRVFWGQDDLFHVALTGWEESIGIAYTAWFSGFVDEMPAEGGYVHTFGRWSPFDPVTVAAEYGVRYTAPQGLAHAFMTRADYLDHLGDLELHVGYQFRFYQHGVGPFDELITPSTVPSLPIRENYYATNSFEYLWLSPIFDQWSHTVMAEARYRLGLFELFAEVEAWLRFFADRDADVARVVGTIDGDVLPGTLTKIFYSSGVRLYPLEHLPHRLAAYVTNKTVPSTFTVTTPEPTRFIRQNLFFLEAEVEL